MQITTRLFGKIEVDENKIICFENGIVGFPECRKFTLVFDEEEKKSISWLQSVDEPEFALPVMDPLLVKQNFNPKVEHELLKSLGELTPENTYVLVTVTAPKQIEELSVNLRAPIIINVDNCKAAQIIIDDNLPVKFMVYEILQKNKEEAGE